MYNIYLPDDSVNMTFFASVMNSGMRGSKDLTLAILKGPGQEKTVTNAVPGRGLNMLMKKFVGKKLTSSCDYKK